MTILKVSKWEAMPVALRHAVLAALLGNELSGYQLAKAFDLGVANFWHARPQQLYAELARLEKEEFVLGREVVQDKRPNKRLFRVTERGLAALESFVSAASKPSFIRDDLMVKVQAADHIDPWALIAQLQERADFARTKIDGLQSLLHGMRGPQDEEGFLLRAKTIGPYLTCLRGVAFEQQNRDWCERVIAILKDREQQREYT